MSEETAGVWFRTATRVLRVIAMGLGIALAALFAWMVFARFAWPIEAEWMTGAIREAVERVRDGKPIYGPPSVEFISFLYPPLYYWIAGLLAKLTSTFVAAKLTSLAATLATAWAIARVGKVLGASRWWIVVSVLLHFGAYSLTLFFYDLERVDVLESTLVMLALVVLLDAETLVRSVTAGVLLGLAFFAKQPGLIAFASVVTGLALAGQRKRALVVGGAGASVLVALAAYLHVTTNGWFWFYCWKLPGAHGIDGRYLTSFLILDAPRAFLLVAGTVTVIAIGTRAVLKKQVEQVGWQMIVFASVLAASMLSAFLLRSHRGGYPNVLLAWTPMACVAVAVAATRAETFPTETRGRALVHLVLLAATSLQLLGWIFDPNDLGPRPSDVRTEQRLRDYVKQLETGGEVLVTTSGDLTRVRHFHSASLYDVSDADQPPPADYVRALDARRFVAILAAAPDDPPCKPKGCRDMRAAITRNYFVAGFVVYGPGRMDGKVGFDGRPRWILRPRKNPFPAATPEKVLDDRRKKEIALAMQHGMMAEDDTLPLPDDTIEDRADGS